LQAGRDEGLLDSALARPLNQFAYLGASAAKLAAGYAFGLVKSHPFFDGNKRIGFSVALVYLESNGHHFNASEADAVVQTLGLATSNVSEADYAAWLAANTSKA